MGFDTLLGKVIVDATGEVGDERMTFTTSDGTRVVLFHSPDCCETVQVAEIIGDLRDLVNDGPVLLAEEVEHENNVNPEGCNVEFPESFTWTFYKLRTLHGDVTIRWLGESNGYYSESVAVTVESA